jgi:flagellar protein FliS
MSRAQLLQQYTQIGVQMGIESASPHRLIQMLLDGALSKIAIATGHMQRNAVAEKGKEISVAISIVNGLRFSLDFEKGGEIAANLDRLYDYAARHLVEANIRNDITALEEVHKLLSEVRSGWMGIQTATANTADYLTQRD